MVAAVKAQPKCSHFMQTPGNKCREISSSCSSIDAVARCKNPISSFVFRYLLCCTQLFPSITFGINSFIEGAVALFVVARAFPYRPRWHTLPMALPATFSNDQNLNSFASADQCDRAYATTTASDPKTATRR